MINMLTNVPNRDLEVSQDNKAQWTRPDHRRWGMHNLHRIARYGLTLRSARTMPLEKRADLRIADLEDVRLLTSTPWFSAMVVVRGQHILFERYAPDFGPSMVHSIQSITKTTLNLIIGRLVEQGALDLSRPIAHYIPEIGSGYATATLQQVLNMDVSNDYSQDFADASATYYYHEEAMGWRLARDPEHEETQRHFIAHLRSSDTTNLSGLAQYKDANADVAGWVAERVSGRPLRAFLADIVDAAGLEGTFYITTDRDGFPTVDGGACLTACDLARYFSIFIRRGRGIAGEHVGSAEFIDRTMCGGVPMPVPSECLRYSNFAMILNRMLGHGGWGGQWAIANLETGTIGIYFSVLEDAYGGARGGSQPVIRMLEAVTGPEF